MQNHLFVQHIHWNDGTLHWVQAGWPLMCEKNDPNPDCLWSVPNYKSPEFHSGYKPALKTINDHWDLSDWAGPVYGIVALRPA